MIDVETRESVLELGLTFFSFAKSVDPLGAQVWDALVLIKTRWKT